MPNAFVGSVRSLTGGTHADPGSLLVVLQNGKPVRVVLPGGRIWRGFRAPAMGSLYVVPINRGSVEVHQVVRGIATRDQEGFVIAAVPLVLRVRLSTSGDYAHLRRFVLERGDSFAEDLLAELRNGVETLVRTVLRQHSHTELYGAPVATLLKPKSTPLEISDGLMLIDSLSIDGQIEWSPVFLKAREAHDSKIIGLASNEADVVVGTDRARVDAQIESARYAEYAGLASKLGVPIEYFVNPDALAASRSTATEILTKLLDPANRSLLHRDPQLLAGLLSATGVSQLARGEALVGSSESVEVLIAGAAERMSPNRLISASVVGQDDTASDMDLNVDKRIARLLAKHLNDGGRVVGLSAVGNGDVATVIVVSADEAIEVPSSFVTQVTSLLNVGHVSIFSLVATSYRDLIEEWLEKAIGGRADRFAVSCTVESRSGLENLMVVLKGEPRAGREVVSLLTGAGRTELAALEALLPFAAVNLQIG